MSKITVELDNGARAEIDFGKDHTRTQYSGRSSTSLSEFADELRKAADYFAGVAAAPPRPAGNSWLVELDKFLFPRAPR